VNPWRRFNRELTGVELTDRGYIKVNERLQTTAPGGWTIGEVAGSPQFTHISVDAFRVVHVNLSGGHRVTTSRQVPGFTHDMLLVVGKSGRFSRRVKHDRLRLRNIRVSSPEGWRPIELENRVHQPERCHL
jgi:pyruvate/2-oxoglutarate dehydrogenase complex dihydrolipoamide dehydrogenase (E3) component